MPRRLREHSVTGIYHVMLRGINRQNIFECPDDYFLFMRNRGDGSLIIFSTKKS